MDAISKLNRVDRRRIAWLVSFVLFVALSVGLLQRQLAAIYARPVAGPSVSAEPSRREDAKLFDQAVAAGLLRQGADGRIAVAPADLPLRQIYAHAYPDLLVPRAGEPDWLDSPWDDKIQRIHRSLHFSASGRYVRQQVETFNAWQWLAAVRWRSMSGLTGNWGADQGESLLTLTTTMPPRAERLFSKTPGDWQPWQRVAYWPVLEEEQPVWFRLALTRPAEKGEWLELLVVGGGPTVIGATVLAEEPRCLGVPSCAESNAVARWLRLELHEGVTGLELSFSPLPAALFPGFRHGFAYIQREGGRLVWRSAAVAGLQQSKGGE